MRCPYCSNQSIPRPSGPYDLSDHVTNVVLLVCPGCDRYTGAFALPRHEPLVDIDAAQLREAA